MKRSIKALWVVAGSLVASAALAGGPQVGVSVEISQPGIYGRVDLGQFPQPQVIVQRPIVIAPSRMAEPEPVYLWVPPGHQRDWRHHCRDYNACGVPVYFVQDRWYRDNVWRGDDRRDSRGGRDDRRGDWEDRRGDRGQGHGGGHGRGRRED